MLEVGGDLIPIPEDVKGIPKWMKKLADTYTKEAVNEGIQRWTYQAIAKADDTYNQQQNGYNGKLLDD